MIQFQSNELNSPVYINAALVCAVSEIGALGLTRIYVCGEHFDVKESAEEVIRKLEL